MPLVRLGAVEYLNARPLVFGLERSTRFALRFDVPSQCAELLHGGDIDVGLIPSIEYLRGSGSGAAAYRIVPDLAIASRGRVASVAIYTTRPMGDVRSIAVDTSSRSSVALARVICARACGTSPRLYECQPDLETMLSIADAALVIGDNALFWNAGAARINPDATSGVVEKIDLGQAWTDMTGLPFVYAFWAGRPGAVSADAIEALGQAKRDGMQRTEEIARTYFGGSPDRQAIGASYLRDNIKFDLGPDERAGLELFYTYAVEAGVVPAAAALRFY